MIAFDTNILVYALEDNSEDARHFVALDLIERTGFIGAIVPFPVIGELFNVCRKKRIANVGVLTQRVELWMKALTASPAVFEDYLSAAAVSQRLDLQYFDALIIEVARRTGATMLLSEDMDDGLEVDGLRIVNPFVAANNTLIADYFAKS